MFIQTKNLIQTVVVDIAAGLLPTITHIGGFWFSNLIFGSTCWDGFRYMVSITLNNTLFSKISNVHIFRTMHHIVMIFSSKCRLQVTWQMLNTFGTVEYSTGPMRTHKETTNSTAKFGSKMAELKTPKIAHETKNWIFSKSKISIHQSNHGKETSNKS